MQPQRQYRIRRRVFLGLGGIVILGVMTLATIAVIQTAQASGVADRTRSGYLLLDHVRELQVAQEASRAAVLAAMATPTASALSDIQVADNVAQAALRGLIPDVAADPVLNGDVERYLASLNAWHDQWAVPVAAILSAGPPASMGQSLAIAVGDQLFATARSELVALRTTAASRMASMVAAYQVQSRIAVTG